MMFFTLFDFIYDGFYCEKALKFTEYLRKNKLKKLL